jgi:hypothetical protein
MHRQKFPSRPIAHAPALVGGDKCFRFTVLTEGLIRYEWAPDKQFEDRRSVFAVNRDLATPQFRVKEKEDSLEIITSRFHLTYDKEPFSPSGFSVVVKGYFGCHQSVWRYGEATPNLGGTARTLEYVFWSNLFLILSHIKSSQNNTGFKEPIFDQNGVSVLVGSSNLLTVLSNC